MKTMKKAVGKKPMVKAKAGMSVKPSPEKKQARMETKTSRQEARDIKRAGKAIDKGAFVPSEDAPGTIKQYFTPAQEAAMKVRGMKKSGGSVAKPKAMYGKTVKSGMMKKGGIMKTKKY